MNKKKDIILIGGGGHCKSCIDVIEQEGIFEIIGIIDSKDKVGSKLLGYPIIGCDDDIKKLSLKCSSFLITLGHIKSADKRIKLFNKLKDLGLTLPTIYSPQSYLSKYATVGEGTIVMNDVVINVSVEIGENCIINSNSLIEHDAIIGSHCHISTSATLNGNTNVKKGTFVGSGAIVNHGITIEERCTIGSGSVIIENIGIQDSIWVGNPAKLLR